MKTTIDMAREVYGAHEWKGAPLDRLEQLVALVRADERALAAPVQEPVAYNKTEMNGFIQDLYDKKMQEGKHGHYETMFHCVHQAIAKVTPPVQPAPVQPVAWMSNKDFEPIRSRIMVEAYELAERDVEGYNAIKVMCGDVQKMLPAQRQWVGLTDEEISASSKGHMTRNGFARTIEAKLREKNAAAQPVVPDAFGTREGEHPEYIQGWNDCRAETLKMRKP
jgi:hypothetical protein